MREDETMEMGFKGVLHPSFVQFDIFHNHNAVPKGLRSLSKCLEDRTLRSASISLNRGKR